MQTFLFRLPSGFQWVHLSASSEFISQRWVRRSPGGFDCSACIGRPEVPFSEFLQWVRFTYNTDHQKGLTGGDLVSAVTRVCVLLWRQLFFECSSSVLQRSSEPSQRLKTKGRAQKQRPQSFRNDLSSVDEWLRLVGQLEESFSWSKFKKLEKVNPYDKTCLRQARQCVHGG